MIEKKHFFKNIDYIVLICVFGIITLGAFVLSSASLSVSHDPSYFVNRHIVWIFLGLTAMFTLMLFNYNTLRKYTLLIYIGIIILLILTIIVGQQGRWISLGPYLFQPSEFAKIAVIIAFAKFLNDRKGRLNTLKDFIPCFAFVGVPMFLIAVGDLGTSMVFLGILFGMLFVAGANARLLVGIILVGLLLVSSVLFAHFNHDLPLPLRDYQAMRLVVFLDPYSDELGGRGGGYHIIQSQIAIGSGGLFGQGLYEGSQTQLNFLPEHHTDFIFSVLGEELGFIGASSLLLLYFGVMYRGLNIALRAKDMFGTLLAAGVISMLCFHVLVNTGMAVGLMPVTGIPLPLFSYGGSSMIATLIGIGLMLNVNIHRQEIRF